MSSAEDIATLLNPRGARPVEHGYKADKCATEKNWPFCSDDDWGPKCPSGCRIQGLLDKADHSLLKKIVKIRQLLDQSRAKHRSADQASKQTYDYLKEKLTSNAGNDNSFYDLAERLRQRIVDIKIKIDRQLRILNALKTSIKEQVIDMQRLEWDIEHQLRSLKGSCKGYAEFSIEKESTWLLGEQMDWRKHAASVCPPSARSLQEEPPTIKTASPGGGSCILLPSHAAFSIDSRSPPSLHPARSPFHLLPPWKRPQVQSSNEDNRLAAIPNRLRKSQGC
ncbi:hypothetical protein J4Q44_G00053270 [Coregonus suidteri]|uniref:Fibrinogen alpha/beta/gamma chain coiled coil domain-containing protein n=1 Tax=Coregonus suidteri TaxID=861788 RepID=A0AAN8M8E3_9TELE